MVVAEGPGLLARALALLGQVAHAVVGVGPHTVVQQLVAIASDIAGVGPVARAVVGERVGPVARELVDRVVGERCWCAGRVVLGGNPVAGVVGVGKRRQRVAGAVAGVTLREPVGGVVQVGRRR